MVKRSMMQQDEQQAARVRHGMKMARSNYKDRYYDAVLGTVEPFAEDGVAEAQAMLGLLYARGKGVAQDFQKSFALFQSAASKGDPEGQYYMGYSYLEGNGVKADQVTALAWFIQAAARGHEEALVERDKGYAALDDTGRMQADSQARDFNTPMPAGWLKDDEADIAFWSSSWYRTGAYKVKIEAPSVDGLAHGEGIVRLTTSMPGKDDTTYDGFFEHGYFYEEEPLAFPCEMLETDDALVDLSARLPANFPGTALWLRERLDGAKITLRAGGSPDVLVVVNDDFPSHEDSAVDSMARAALAVVAEVRPLSSNGHATVTTIPHDHTRIVEDGKLRFEPRQAEISLTDFGGDPSDWTVSITNLSAQVKAKKEYLEKQAREEAEREARQREIERRALEQGTLDIRGLQIGMTIADVHALFEDEIESWAPNWDSDRKMPAFERFKQSFQLRDKASFEATFTSSQNGSRLFTVGYKQTLRNGPTPAELRASLEDKYGKSPDEKSGGTRLTWFAPNASGNATGIVLNMSFGVDQETKLVSKLNLSIGDYDLATRDESMARDARLKEERETALQKIEATKSDVAKF